MVKFENECVGCPQGCINCGRKRVKVFSCDRCEVEYDPEDLYDFDDEMLCEDCLLAEFRTINESDYD